MANAVTEIQRFRVNRNAWKSNLANEIIDLEDNLDQLFDIVRIKPHRVVITENSEIDESTIVTNNKRIRDNEPSGREERTSSYQAIIDEHFEEIHKATSNICALITSVTEFDLPIPVQVLLRLAARLNLLRWSDFKKKLTGSLSKEYVYKISPSLIEESFKLFKWISVVLGTNALPFQSFINHNIMTILDWTRTSGLKNHDEVTFLKLRSQLISNISALIESLSTNINFDPKQLVTLIDIEILETLNDYLVDKQAGQLSLGLTNGVFQRSIDQSISKNNKPATVLNELKDNYALDALQCLERVFVVYADFLDAPQEQRIKSFVIQTCLKIYRDFERNVIGLALRRQLIRMVETLANRPYASSTTELAWYIFELAERHESNAEIKFIARRSIKVGLAHRPTIVSNYGIYSSYVGKLLPAQSSLTNGVENEKMVERPADLEAIKPDELDIMKPEEVDERPKEPKGRLDETGKSIENKEKKPEEIEVSTEATEKRTEEIEKRPEEVEKRPEEIEKRPEEIEEKPEDDPQVQSYLSLFVDKPAE